LQLLELVAAVTAAVKIPVAVKLSQSFTSVPHLVARLEDAGARGVVLFNRFYQPDFDIETLEVRPTLHFSTPSELLPRLHWAAILFGHVKLDVAISGGIHSAEDVLKGVNYDDGFGAAHSWHRAHRQGSGRPDVLAGEARIPLVVGDARMPEPAVGSRHVAVRSR